MRPFEADLDLLTPDPDGLADNNASDDVTTNITLDGALTSGGTWTSSDGLAHILEIKDTATQDQSDSTFTITGTDADGNAQTEDVTGPASGATVPSIKYYKTVTTISVSGGDSGDTVDIGTLTAGAARSQTYLINWRSDNAATYVGVQTGTATWSVQENFADLTNSTTSPAQHAGWVELVTNCKDETGSNGSAGTPNAVGCRVQFDSYSTGAELQLYVSQGND